MIGCRKTRKIINVVLELIRTILKFSKPKVEKTIKSILNIQLNNYQSLLQIVINNKAQFSGPNFPDTVQQAEYLLRLIKKV